jgi:hypothetical protein
LPRPKGFDNPFLMPNNSEVTTPIRDIRDEIDPESVELLNQIQKQDRVKTNRIAGVRTVLVILSSKGMVFDSHSLRHEIRQAYPDAAVFFKTPLGVFVGGHAPAHVDLLIDLTGPGERAPFFFARRLRRSARVAIGRNSGLFSIRKRVYDRIYDEKTVTGLPSETLDRERFVQKQVLDLAGVGPSFSGETHADLGKSIALELPPMLKI